MLYLLLLFTDYVLLTHFTDGLRRGKPEVTLKVEESGF